ncbi:MAG: hypothetical protein PHY48_10560 [Candidatus Cloacimonetes bacterium]|nr:hypothetical protein [Candidatus Cloacimonadota bacterium]MDD2229840.1 hypothetical protein [Candidatus Cloacimonadota bacterium]
MQLHKCDGYHLKCFNGKQLIALLPIFEKKLLSYRAVICPSSAYYQGLNLWMEAETRPARMLLDTLQVHRLIASYLQCRYQRIHFNLTPDTNDVRGFTWEKLKAKPLYTFVHDYANAGIPLAEVRKNLSKAKKLDFHFAEKLNVSALITLIKAMNQRKNLESGISFHALEGFYYSLHEAGLLRQFNLYHDSRIVSSNVLLKNDNKIAYTVLMATEKEALSKGASSLHTLALIDALKPELAELDFCGANVADVARFKTAMGLKLKVFYQIHT